MSCIRKHDWRVDKETWEQLAGRWRQGAEKAGHGDELWILLSNFLWDWPLRWPKKQWDQRRPQQDFNVSPDHGQWPALTRRLTELPHLCAQLCRSEEISGPRAFPHVHPLHTNGLFFVYFIALIFPASRWQWRLGRLRTMASAQCWRSTGIKTNVHKTWWPAPGQLSE